MDIFLGSWFEPNNRQNMKGVLVVVGGAETPSGHNPGTLEQGTVSTNAHIGPCSELATHSGVIPAFTLCVPSP